MSDTSKIKASAATENNCKDINKDGAQDAESAIKGSPTQNKSSTQINTKVSQNSIYWNRIEECDDTEQNPNVVTLLEGMSLVDLDDDDGILLGDEAIPSGNKLEDDEEGDEQGLDLFTDISMRFRCHSGLDDTDDDLDETSTVGSGSGSVSTCDGENDLAESLISDSGSESKYEEEPLGGVGVGGGDVGASEE